MKCPYCSDLDPVKKGVRRNQNGEKQVYLCKYCGKRFVEEKEGSYPKHIAMETLNLHTLGMGIDKIQADLIRRYKVRPSRSTIQRWIHKYRGLCPMRKNRDELAKIPEVIRETEFVHRGLTYRFGYNLFKLNFLKGDLSKLKEYILDFQDKPQFQDGSRCSEAKVEVNVERSTANNLASKMAAFATKAARNNTERHEILERFMLINDTATIAKELPVYYWDKKIGTVTGHIDILQVRFGKVHILDYKPEANKEHPEGQLLLYAMGLMFRTGLPLEKMECAWFDKDDYFSFSPSKAKWKWQV